MNEINAICQELIEYGKQYNQDEISYDELQLKLDLVIGHIERIEINYWQPLDSISKRTQDAFESLLSRTKAKAIISINTLNRTNDKRSFNAKARKIITCKLYFNALHSTLKRNINGYIHRNNLQYWNLNHQIFILGGNENE